MENITIGDTRDIFQQDVNYDRSACKFTFWYHNYLSCGHNLCRLCIYLDINVIECLGCSKVAFISEIRFNIHLVDQMDTLRIILNQCNTPDDLQNYLVLDHLKKLHNDSKYSSCNESYNSLALVQHHREVQCSNKLVTCALQSYGCDALVQRCNLVEHYLSSMHQHIVVLCISRMISKLNEDDLQVIDFDRNHDRITSDLLPQASVLSANNTTYNRDISLQESYDETVNVLSDGIEILNDDIQQLSDESLKLAESVKANQETVSQLKASCTDSGAALDALQLNTHILQQQLYSLRDRVEAQDSISYDGTFIWKIINVGEKTADAKSERHASIYSPPFYTSLTGYKVCVRLYLNGDGNARHTHMSLFFVLMRGRYDSLLKFPFDYKVTFCLYDQSGEQRHIINSFRPDKKSMSFQRPRFDMNIASGIPKFVSLETLEKEKHRYIKDNTMFIKIMIDFENLPNSLLPYAATSNPGIPKHLQHRLLQEEKERLARMQLPVNSAEDLTNGTVVDKKHPSSNHQS